MSEELLFAVAGSVATPAEVITLEAAGLKERADLQEWVIAHPAILGTGVMVVTFEFDRWWTTSGPPPQDRLDVLGLDDAGRLVVAELKRGKAPDATEMQAIKYAAMASRFTLESLADQYAKFRTGRGQSISADEALAELQAYAPDLSPETLRRPRIVLVAREYPPVVTATAVWLSEMGLDLSLVQFKAYRSRIKSVDGTEHEQLLISVSQLYPVRDVEEFTVSPERQQAKAAAETKKRAQDLSTVRRLVDAQEVADDTVFVISPRNDINADMRAEVEKWLDDKEGRRTARWQNKAAAPLIWDGDDQEYTPSGLVRHIVLEATGVNRGFYGTQWWRNPDGWTLVELAAPLGGGKSELYRAFWTRWLERVKVEHPAWTQMFIPPPQSWVTMPSPLSGTQLGVSFAAGGRLRSEIYFSAGDADANLALFNMLEAQRKEVELAYGSELSWEKLPERVASRIAAYSDGDVSNTTAHEAYIDWMMDSQVRIRKGLAAVGYSKPGLST